MTEAVPDLFFGALLRWIDYMKVWQLETHENCREVYEFTLNRSRYLLTSGSSDVGCAGLYRSFFASMKSPCDYQGEINCRAATRLILRICAPSFKNKITQLTRLFDTRPPYSSIEYAYQQLTYLISTKRTAQWIGAILYYKLEWLLLAFIYEFNNITTNCHDIHQ